MQKILAPGRIGVRYFTPSSARKRNRAPVAARGVHPPFRRRSMYSWIVFARRTESAPPERKVFRSRKREGSAPLTGFVAK